MSDLVERLRVWADAADEGDRIAARYALGKDADPALTSAMGDDLRAAAAALTALARLRALLTARAKDMVKAREAFINIRDELEDEGDRIYFGSTNHADDFKQAVEMLDSWAWDDIMRDATQEDIIGQNRELRAEIARLREALTAERERCAKIAEEHPWPTQTTEALWPIERTVIAAAIRGGSDASD